MQTISDKARAARSSALFRYSYFKPHIGGHAPGDLRDAFSDAVDAFEAWESGEPEPAVELRDKRVPISTIFGLCWNCSDCLPSDLVFQIEQMTDQRPGSYAAAARLLKSEISA